MLKKIGILVCITLMYCMPVCPEMHDVTVTWDYNNPPPDFAGFDLRVNGNNSTLISISPTARSWSGLLDVEDGNNVIDMQAKDLSGKVSVWSDPCNYDPNYDPPIDIPTPPTGFGCGG